MCFKQGKRKKRRRSGKRVRRKDPGILGYQEEEDLAQEILSVDRPDHNIIEPIPMTDPAQTVNLNTDSVSYSKSPDPPVHMPPPHPNRISQSNPDFKRNEMVMTDTLVGAVEEEKKEVVRNFDLIKPVREPAFVDSQDYYPVPRESKARRKDRQVDFTKRVEYRSRTPEIKKIVVPQMISVNVLQAGCRQPKIIATNTSDTVFELRFKIFESTRILPTNQILAFRARELPLDKQLGECGIEDRSYVELTDHGKDITEYIIEITDAKAVLQLKSDLRKLEDDLMEVKKRSTDMLRQNEWIDASRLVGMARVLEVKKTKKLEELKEIHQRHKNGFRQLHIKIMRLFAEKRKSSAEYAKLKDDLVGAIHKNQVLRSRDIIENLVIQFICHDGCERELMLLEGLVPDMVEAARVGIRNEGLDDPSGETKKTPSPRDLTECEPPVIQARPMPRGQGVYGEEQYYVQNGRYSTAPVFQEATIVPARGQWTEGYYEPQPLIQFEPVAQQLVSGGMGDPGAYYQ